METGSVKTLEKLGCEGDERPGAGYRDGVRKCFCVFIIIACIMMVETCLNSTGKEPAKEKRLTIRQGSIYCVGPGGGKGADT